MSDPRSQSIFTRGAVDLSALRDRAAAASRTPAQPAQPANGSAGGAEGAAPGTPPAPTLPGTAVTVIDVTEATFQAEIVERSMNQLVVIDFWAEWCGPCKQLSPVLEKLAAEGQGAWVLAKIDVDANPRLAQAFRVQGIPMVYAVLGGQPVDAFSGVVPEAQLRQWLDNLLKASGVEVAEPEDPVLSAADDALMSGDLDAAEAAYKKILNERPADGNAEAGLAQVGLFRRVQGIGDPAAALAAADAAPDDIEAQFSAADLEVVSGNAELAYNRLIALVRRVFGEDRDRVRQHLVGLFAVAGPDDPAVANARRALASALF
ncbi:tetratricopeptide repeat protein [Luedemannella helvata]